MKISRPKLPQSIIEKIIFQLVVSIISVNIIVPIIVMQKISFSMANYLYILHMIPFMWIAVIISIIIANKPANFLKNMTTSINDSFRAQTIINILWHVLIVSALMTIFSDWIRNQAIELAPFFSFFDNWPHNFGIAFVVQVVVSQPIARKIIGLKHRKG